MDINQSPRVVSNKLGGQNSHKAGENHQSGGVVVDNLNQLLIIELSLRPLAMIFNRCWDSRLFGTQKALCIRNVADHRLYPGRKPLLRNGIQNGLKITASARDQDNE